MTEPRLPTMKEMEEIVKAETMYKVAHVEDEKPHFNFSSCYIGHPCRSGCYYHQQQLKYVVGKVTTAPSGSNGIWCYSSGRVEFAQRHAMGEAGIIIQPPCVVLEVKPLGKFYLQDKPMSVYVVGVYEKKEEYANPFKVGDRVKVKESVEKPKYGWGIGGLVTHGDIGVVKEVSRTKLEVFFPRFCGGTGTWLAHAPEMELVPEPREEWVDVTRECKLSFLHAWSSKEGGEYIDLVHDGTSVACLGLGGYYQAYSIETNYKVELTKENYLGNMGTFRILKKELK